MNLEYFGGIDKEKPEVLFAALQTLLTNTKDMIFVKDINLVYTACTQSFAAITEMGEVQKVLGHTDFEIFASEELATRYVKDDKRLLSRGKDLLDYVEPLPEENGEPRYGSTSKYILKNENGEQIGLLGWTIDVTQQIKANEHYQQELRYLFNLPPDVYSALLIDIDDWRIVTQRSRELLGYTVPDFETVERFVEIASTGVVRNAEAYSFFRGFTPDALKAIYNSGKTSFTMEYQRRWGDGKLSWVCDEMSFMTDPQKGHLCLGVSIKNIDEKMRVDEKLWMAATTDQLTSLLNRAETERSIRAFLTGDGADKLHALFMIDIDNFKTFNDTLGHQQGDMLLTQVARTIKGCFRETDIVGRMGGDEFFVLMKNVKLRSAVSERAERLLAGLPEIRCDGGSIRATVSIGISLFSNDGLTFHELYESADKALYEAKNRGKNRAVFFEEIKDNR